MQTARSILIALLVVGGLGRSVAKLDAQDARPIVPGDRVRVRLRGVPPIALVGSVEWFGRDTLFVQTAAGFAPGGGSRAITWPLAVGDIRSLELSDGIHTHLVRGIILGAAAGAAAGIDVGWASGSDIRMRASQKAFAYGVSLAAFGAGVGGVVGNAVRYERWIAVPVEHLRVAPSATGGVLIAFGW